MRISAGHHARQQPCFAFCSQARSRPQRPRANVRQEIRQQPDRRQEGADLIDEGQAREVGDFPQRRRPDAAEPERQPEEQPGDRADIAGHQLLRIDDDCREGRGEDEADRDRVDHRPELVEMRQRQGERQHADDRSPDHEFSSKTVADRAADESSRRHGAEKDEQIDLRILHRDVESLNEIEGVIA